MKKPSPKAILHGFFNVTGTHVNSKVIWTVILAAGIFGTEITGFAMENDTEELPVFYDSRDAGKTTVIKNQGNFGTCWALTAATALEAGLLPQEEWNFSADHISLQNSFGQDQSLGGDYLMLMAYFAGWQGPVLESEDPYGDGYSPDGLLPAKHVQEMELLQSKDYQKIKESVYRYGAVQSSLYMDLEDVFSYSVYYNQLNASYLYNGEENANHDVLIIGWDDTYPAENFNVYTEKDGAFICQNSWGEEFGDRGIFYVSYEDCIIGNNAIVYSEIEDADNYAWMEQTDLCGWVGQLGYGDGSCYFANVFHEQQGRTLEAVGFYTTGIDTKYRIYVIEGAASPEDFYLEEIAAQGTIPEKGYHTVQLDVPRKINESSYAVVIYLESQETQYPVATEFIADETTKNVTIADGDGYISHKGNDWTGSESQYQCNVCMKTYGSYQ